MSPDSDREPDPEMAETAQTPHLTVRPLAMRPMRFEFDADMDVVWHRLRPEFACAANGVSMLMPYVEPYVVQSVRGVVDQLDGPLEAETKEYLRQEGQHHAQHRRFNDLLVGRFSALGHVEGVMRSVFDWLSARRTTAFGVAFAAGFEAVAYAAARWTDEHRHELFDGADERASRIFLWHLAEEVEHKSVAIDVHRATGGSRLLYAGAMLVSAVLLAIFTWVCTMIMLIDTRRVFSPVAHLRLLRWTVSFLFELLPAMLLSISGNHHPSQLADPLFYELWLTENRSD